MSKFLSVSIFAVLFFSQITKAQQTFSNDLLKQRQLDFVNLGFGMFIHYGMPTFMDQDWSDPDAPLSLFNSSNFNPDQWAKAAKSANMTYGCLTTKHHSGFPIWDTKTTDYNVMNTTLHKDVVKEFVNAFRKNGLHVMLYYSILDMHNGIRPNDITEDKIEMIKKQITELLTNYGEIDALVIDGWDAPWSRISYDNVPFNDIYYLIKSLQPKCLVMDLNSAKYPGDALFYTDIKSYEQGAGQFISKEHNKLPAMACLPLQRNWFWKNSFPTTPVKNVDELVNKFIMPYNEAYCNFMLNVAPGSNGLIDQNALDALKEIGKIYKKKTPYNELPIYEAPIVAQNISKHILSHSSWSDDMNIMDFANDDDFVSAWSANPKTKGDIWYALQFQRNEPFNCIVVTGANSYKGDYTITYFKDGKWLPLKAEPKKQGRITVFRFDEKIGEKIKLQMENNKGSLALFEVGVYNERR